MWQGSSKTNTLRLVDDDSGTTISPDETFTYVNEFFCNIGSKLAEPLIHLPGNIMTSEVLREANIDEASIPLIGPSRQLLKFDYCGHTLFRCVHIFAEFAEIKIR